jgi:hypothetical protein
VVEIDAKTWNQLEQWVFEKFELLKEVGDMGLSLATKGA